MAFCVNPASQGNFTFGQTVAGFLTSPGLPFVDILSEQRIACVFRKHGGLFGRTYTTAIVLWAFMSQVLRDGKEASCQSAVARISSYLTGRALGDVDPDTRDYCRARAKLSEDASPVGWCHPPNLDSRVPLRRIQLSFQSVPR